MRLTATRSSVTSGSSGAVAVPDVIQEANPDLDLNFVKNKSLLDDVSGNNLVTFTRSSSATFVGSNGLIQTATTNTPRFDHSATGESLGLLIEESSTNRNTKSKSFSNWAVSSGFSLDDDAATAPDGTTSATALDRNGGGLARLEANFSVGSGQSTTFSVFAKSVNTTTGRYLRLAVNDAQSGERFADFDLVDGTIDVAAANGGNFTGAVSRIEEYPNDWYRCSITFSKTSSGSENSICFHKLYIRQSDNSTNTPSGVTDVGMHIWGGQVERKTFPTSLIETDGSTVTRAADVVEITGTNFSSFYNSTEGTIYSEVVPIGVANSSFPRIYQFWDPSNSEKYHRLSITNSTAPFALNARTKNGGSQASFTSNTFTVGQVLKTAYSYKANDFDVSFSAGSSGATSDTSGNIPTGVNQVRIGARAEDGNYLLTGHIKRFAFFAPRLTDSKMAQITS